MTLPKIYCALDTDHLDQAQDWARAIGPVTGGLKLGLEFFNRFGPQGIEAVQEACPQASIFLDLKLHDIPNTVAAAVKTLTSNLQPAFLNVHAAGGAAMMEAALAAVQGKTQLISVTILTSLDNADMDQIGYANKTADQVVKLAGLTKQAGLAGIVCSAHDLANVQQACGNDFITMVPGIRPAGSAKGDQKRVMTPPEAIHAGAKHIVIGRPITQAPDPAKAAADILESIA